MRILTASALLIAACEPALAQTGGSFLTSDGINRAPATALHCIGAGNIAVPCGTTMQPLYVAGPAPLASAANQATQLLSEQAIAAAAGTPQDPTYVTGSGSIVALLKGVFAALTTGISAAPSGGTLVSRSVSLPATQSTQLFPPNPLRHSLAFQAPAGSALWVNFLGGVAAPNGIDCVQLSAGTLYESGSFVTRGAVTVYTAVAVGVAAWEG